MTNFKKICLVSFLMTFAFNAFADLYDDFISTNENYFAVSDSFFSKQSLEVYNTQGKVSELQTYSIFSKTSQFSAILKNTKVINFLSTDKGYWISNSNLRNPLKVSGSYQVEDIAVQDILRFNFDVDFSITEKMENAVFMERKNKKISYAFAILEKENENFILTLQDSKKNSIKKIVYSPDFIGNIKMFTRVYIYNLALDSDEYRCYVTKSISPIKIAASLFIPENMQVLEKIGKKEYEK